MDCGVGETSGEPQDNSEEPYTLYMPEECGAMGPPKSRVHTLRFCRNTQRVRPISEGQFRLKPAHDTDGLDRGQSRESLLFLSFS